jgi:hypothetical protein
MLDTPMLALPFLMVSLMIQMTVLMVRVAISLTRALIPVMMWTIRASIVAIQALIVAIVALAASVAGVATILHRRHQKRRSQNAAVARLPEAGDARVPVSAAGAQLATSARANQRPRSAPTSSATEPFRDAPLSAGVSGIICCWVPAPGWPAPPAGWSPPPGWRPSADWPAPPPDWQWWQPTASPVPAQQVDSSAVTAAANPESVKQAKQAAVGTEASVANIRKWAWDNGYEVSQRGRLPGVVIAAYQAAHAQLRAA